MSFHAIKHLRTQLVRSPFNMPAPVISQRSASLTAAKAQLATRGARALSSRASKVLSAVGLPTDGSSIPGVYDGAWGGSGEIIETMCPSTGDCIGRVVTVSIHPFH